MNENKPEQRSRLQLRLDLILTVFFLAVIFFFGIMTVSTDFNGIYKAGTMLTKLKAYMPEDYDAWDLLAARVKSVDAYLGENIYKASELGQLNSSFQYALGKRMVSTGASTMLRLNTGHLYDLQAYTPMEGAVQNIADMQALVPEDVPFLFVYEHPTLYSAEQMPEGYDVLDHSAEMADEIVSGLRAAGIELLDSREILPATGLDIRDYLMYTDQHWATRASIEMARAITEKAESLLNAGLDSSALDIANFETEVYPKLFLGKYGQRIGTANIDPDDITIYWPKADVNVTRETFYKKTLTETSGSFRDSVIRWEYLTPEAGKSWNTKAYCDYDLVEDYNIYTNEAAPDCTILLLKDSYAAPIASFLPLVAGKVVAVDLRRNVDGLSTWIEKYDPDIVIASYSLQMLRDDNYDFQ